MMTQKQNDDVIDVSNNSLIDPKDLTSIFRHHGDQFLKFHFLPFLNVEEKTNLRATCQTMKSKISQQQYSYFETYNGGKARLEKNTGFVETCGTPQCGGDSSRVQSYLQADVKTIVSSKTTFAALKKNGRVITWGYLAEKYYVPETDLESNVTNIISTDAAFAALKTNGKVITWGHHNFGGDSSNVRSDLQFDVKTIVSCGYAFAALKTNGSVITWGEPHSGGNSSNVSSDLQSDVKLIVSTHAAFAALKTNGKVITWGNHDFGGDSSNVSSDLQSDVKTIVATDSGFTALKKNGSTITW
jgi:predicted alpha/beta-hydrolase family hydrolase